MKACRFLFALMLLAVAGGADACTRQEATQPPAGQPASSEPAAEVPASAQPAETAVEDGVVAYDSTTHGALQVMSANDRPKDWFLVFQGGERAVPGNPPLLNKTVELPPGVYDVDVNHTRRTVTIEAGRKTIVWTGELEVAGEPEGAYWYPMQGDQRALESNPPILGSARAFFPGTYTVFVHTSVAVPDDNLGSAEVTAGEKTVLHHK